MPDKRFYVVFCIFTVKVELNIEENVTAACIVFKNDYFRLKIAFIFKARVDLISISVLGYAIGSEKIQIRIKISDGVNEIIERTAFSVILGSPNSDICVYSVRIRYLAHIA